MEENQIKKIVLIGGSAGSLQALFGIFSALLPDFPYAIVLVLHRQSGQDNLLDEVLSRRTGLKAKEIEEKDAIEPNNIYVCPADYHVLIEQDETFSLDDSEKVNYSRPSLDVVFTSAADVYGQHLIGIVLSGANADGAEGLRCIKQKGGITIVQDPEDAAVSYMPEKALEMNVPDYCLTATAIGKKLKELSLPAK